MAYIGKSVSGVQLSQAVKAGKWLFVSGTPGFDGADKIAAGDLQGQIKQAMDGMIGILAEADTAAGLPAGNRM